MTDEDKALVERLRGDLPDKKVESHWVTDYTAVEMQNREAANRIEAQAAEIEKLREALLDALSHCYNCSGDPHYIEEDEVTGDHLWTDCPICRSARAALGETK